MTEWNQSDIAAILVALWGKTQGLLFQYKEGRILSRIESRLELIIYIFMNHVKNIFCADEEEWIWPQMHFWFTTNEHNCCATR